MSDQKVVNNDLTFSDLRFFLDNIFLIISKYKFKILSISIFIAFLFGGYAWLQPKSYVSKTIFIVEESKSTNGLGSLGNLVGQLGVDILNNSGGNLISGDNIFVYLKSETLIKKVLKSKWDSSRSIFDVYIYYHSYLDKWKNDKNFLSVTVDFSYGNESQKRIQDSLLQIVTEKILKHNVFIEKLDKKTGFIKYQVKMNNELLTKVFSEKLLELAVNDYISLKTEKQLKTVNSLQDRSDSLFKILNKKTISTAQLQVESSVMDINPINKSTFLVNNETNNRDKMMLVAMYSEVVKNLEIAKFTLSQQTPVFQIIDRSDFPLKIEKASIVKYSIFSFVFVFLLQIFFLYIKNVLKF